MGVPPADGVLAAGRQRVGEAAFRRGQRRADAGALGSELEARLRAEVARTDQPVAAIIREILHEALATRPVSRSRHAGAFASGRSDIASRADDVLHETGFGGE